MPRKEIDVKIEADGRDKGKTFHIMEMSAWDAERWALRAFFEVMNSGVEIDDRLVKAGMAGIAIAGIQAFGKVPFERAQPLLNELLTCVKYKFGMRPEEVRAIVAEDVEEPGTILQLRAEALNLHVNFPVLVAPWRSMTSFSETILPEQNSSSTLTSPAQSQPRFHPGKRRMPSSK